MSAGQSEALRLIPYLALPFHPARPVFHQLLQEPLGAQHASSSLSTRQDQHRVSVLHCHFSSLMLHGPASQPSSHKGRTLTQQHVSHADWWTDTNTNLNQQTIIYRSVKCILISTKHLRDHSLIQ